MSGVNVVNGKNGIHFTYVKDGRPSGEAYLELESQHDLDQALSKDKHHMGKRYIDGLSFAKILFQSIVINTASFRFNLQFFDQSAVR